MHCICKQYTVCFYPDFYYSEYFLHISIKSEACINQENVRKPAADVYEKGIVSVSV